jgi:Holliday junction resolvase-like predicted endonuclease
MLLLQLFDFQPLLYLQETMVRIFAEFFYRSQASLKQLQDRTLMDLRQRVTEVADKWRQKIAVMPIGELRDQEFLERVRRSAQYFEETLNGILAKPIELTANVEPTNKIAKKRLENALPELRQTWVARRYLLHQMAEQGFTVSGYLKEKQLSILNALDEDAPKSRRSRKPKAKKEVRKEPEVSHNELGTWGEIMAADYLLRNGYLIRERDWKSGHRDLDIIAQDGETLVVVEVKTRRNRTYTDPERAVNYQKMQNLRMAANHYVKYHHINAPVRFDIITVTGTPGDSPEIEHIQDAF